MTQAPRKNRSGSRWVAGCLAASLSAATVAPAAAQGSPPGAPLDPYGAAPLAAPLDPYPPAPPPLLPAPMLRLPRPAARGARSPQPVPLPAPLLPAPLLPAPLLPRLEQTPTYPAPIDPYAPYAPSAGIAYPPPPPPMPPLPPQPPPPPPPGACFTEDCVDSLAYRPASSNGTELRPRYGVLAAGISLLGGLWVVSSVSGALSERHELAVPLIGPILTAMDLNHSYTRSAGLSAVTGLLITDALLQTTGLILAIAGGASRVAVPRRAPQPGYYTSTRPSISPYGAGLSVRF